MWNDWGHNPMIGYDGAGWSWMMGFHGVFGILFMALVVFAAIALIRYLWHAGSPGRHGLAAGHGIAVLERRYAEGDIDRDEYRQKKQDLV